MEEKRVKKEFRNYVLPFVLVFKCDDGEMSMENVHWKAKNLGVAHV